MASPDDLNCGCHPHCQGTCAAINALSLEEQDQVLEGIGALGNQELADFLSMHCDDQQLILKDTSGDYSD
ncbi:hypothetical protein CYMTET_26275 [Cymbomonas tetramitiformis]|uniref:Uncharacterized protein n=1 Tax=Cymbomonas tetramitiformis TaxID=36881 RepID=A0AAE0FS49_9CHLO|nr:hypothetical protein CYMTET_26275 [Cymbomonas tetramitiformis]